MYALTRAGASSRDAGLVDQMRRAAVSTMSNIAEGFERGSTAEFIQFLYVAKGSCGEVRAQLRIARDQEYLAPADYDRLHDLARRISGMISNFIAHLEGSGYRGGKYRRPQHQAAEAAERRQEAVRAAQLANIRAAEKKPSENPPEPS